MLILSPSRIMMQLMQLSFFSLTPFSFTFFSSLIPAFAVYACILADPDTSYIGRLCMITIPSTLYQFVQRTIPQKWLSKLSKLVDHGFQLIYLVVVLGSWSIVFNYGEFVMPSHTLLLYKNIIFALIKLSLYTD